MSPALATVIIGNAGDVFAVRQAGRIAAAAVGCEEADQVRFATALSEIGREALGHGTGSTAVFDLDADGAVVVAFERFPRAALPKSASAGVDAARKLVDDIAIVDGPTPSTVTIVLRRPGTAARPRSSGAADLRAALGRAVPAAPLEQLRLENHDLIATLDELKRKQDELVRLNDELEETNRGVMAMYAQLADELEETNRGVVALYAELDDKTVLLNAANEAKSRFLASVSHELRSPVTSIIGLARLLSDPSGDALTSEQSKQLRLMGRSASDLLTLVNQLLDLSKAEAGRLQPEIARVDIAAVFSDLRGALRPLFAPDVEFVVDPPEVASIDSDRTLFEQVVRNLLTNAVKFTQRGSIRLSARRITPYSVRITVADTGIGIGAEDQARVFEEFYQVRGPLQAVHRGTGLGLPYARRVAETLGGTLSVESRLGEGSTFALELPTAWQPLFGSSTMPASKALSDIRLQSVAIVDDDDGFRTILRGLLHGWAKDVHEATGGSDGLAMMRSARPDVAFVDLRMPDMDGGTVLERMSAEPELRDVPVVIVTSVPLTPAVRGTLGGARAMLAKSTVTRDVLHRVLAETLRLTPDTA